MIPLEEDTSANHAVASYFQTMRMRLSGLSNYKENKEIRDRAREMLKDINESDMTRYECVMKYWDESISLKEAYWAEK